MTIATEIQSLSPSAMIEMFILDMTGFGGTMSYFHAGTNGLQQPVVWQGNQYVPLPIEAEGFEITAKGSLPRPRLRVANINGLFSAEVHQHDDLVGCRIIRKRTFARYLDAVNFPGGVNANADPNQHLPDDVWFIEQKTTENRYIIEWQLSSAFDLQGVMLPFRQVIQNTCSWSYRGPECGYTGTPFDKSDQPCAAANDFCAKRLTSCKVRHVNSPTLPYGGFPGAVRYGA